MGSPDNLETNTLYHRTMITTGIILVIAQALTLIIAQFPTGSLPTPFANSLDLILGYVFKFEAILPLSTLWQGLIAIITFEILTLNIRLVLWPFKFLTGLFKK